MKVAIGGTFNVLHRGHRVLLETAFSRGLDVIVGITSDDFARDRKSKHIPLDERRKKLEEYLSSNFDRWEVDVLEDPMGPTASEEDIGILIVSPDTHAMGEMINEVRVKNGFKPMELVRVNHVLAEDYLPISSTRILAGEIDTEGKLSRPLRVVVGSTNPVKIKAVRNVMGRILRSCDISDLKVETTVGEQPFEEATLAGAKERAQAALEHGDLGVGIEAGVFSREDGLYDIQYCAIADRAGWITVGHGTGFMYPPRIAEMVRSGMAVNQAFERIHDIFNIGKKEGAIGFLTKGMLTREQLTEQSVMAAMIPRLRVDLYTDI
jgi:inosine/xanthosine triphosphatase